MQAAAQPPLICPSLQHNPHTTPKHKHLHKPMVPSMRPPPRQPPHPATGGLNLETTNTTPCTVATRAKANGHSAEEEVGAGKAGRTSVSVSAFEVDGANFSATAQEPRPLPKGPAAALMDSANLPWPGPGPGPTPTSSSGAPTLSRPRPARTLPPDLYRIHECKAWDERAVHLMRSSSRVQDYLRKEGSYSLATRAAEQTLGTRSNKRRRESQDRRSVKRPSLATPTDAYRAIFARSSLLRQRFSALATS